MDKSWYSFDVPVSWMLLSLVVAAGLSVVLYAKQNVPWSRSTNILMGFLRMAAIFLILLLLLNPLLKLSINQTNPPIVVLAVDNSESVKLRASESEIKAYLQQLSEGISEEYKVERMDLSLNNSDSISFDEPTTNLAQLLHHIESVYEGENLAGVVLASDGIVNTGALPQYSTYSFPVFTLGLGDTIAPKDLQIHEVRNNRIAYQGNKFPVSVSVRQKGFDGQIARLTVSEGGRILEQSVLQLDKPASNHEFQLEAKDAGLKHLVVSISKLDGESSAANNQKDIYINVIEGKEKILILAPAPHPDIGAIRKVLASASNYETTLFIPGVSEGELEAKYDVVIEHQAFDRMDYPKVEAAGKWMILGSKAIVRANRDLSYLNVIQKGNESDMVRPAYNREFSKFKLDPENLEVLSKYPPLQVPFGNYSVSGPVELLFAQQIGSVKTDRPLMFFYDDGTSKSAVTMGSGVWQWRLQEAGLSGESPLFDEMVVKTVQFLSIKADKKRFIARPRRNIFNETDRVFIDTEVYNEIYERSYGNRIRLKLTDEDGTVQNLELVDNEMNSAFNIGRLPQGVYKYTASTDLKGKDLVENGEFIVKQIQLEAQNLQANHHNLRALSKKTDGLFFPFSDKEKLTEYLQNQDFKNVITTSEQLFPLVNSMWVIGLIVLLLSIEWFLRKYLGAY